MVTTAENESPDSGEERTFDLVIIGGGPGGYAAALYGASSGMHIAMVEKHKVGGTCLHVGCIPAKELLETAAVYRTVANAADFGVTSTAPTVDFAVTQIRKQKIVDQLHAGLSSLLKNRKVTVFDGVGSLHAGHVVKVTGGSSGDVELYGEHVIIATGSVPRTIPGFDVDGMVVMTSDEVLSMQDLPKRAVVIGGGAIGCEFASMMADLGTQVTVLEALPKILPGVDDDVAKLVARIFKKRGIDIRTGVKVTGHTPRDGGTTVHVEGGDDIETDVVVVSIGRRPLTEGLGLEGTAVKVDDRGFVEVDDRCRTAEPGVYAVGDVINTPALAHVGFAESIMVIKHILGEDPLPVNYDAVPWCIYCHPEVAFAGLSEEAAKDAGYDVVTSKHRYNSNSRAMIVGEAEGMVKVIAEKDASGGAGRVLGVHMVGPWVTEQLGQAYLSVNWEASIDEIAQFIQPHPTLSETFGETVLSLTGRSLH